MSYYKSFIAACIFTASIACQLKAQNKSPIPNKDSDTFSSKLTFSDSSSLTNNVNAKADETYHPDSIKPSFEWINPSAEAQQKAVVIQWSTTGKNNHSHFVIERSTNLKDWSPIGAMKAAGNSQPLKNYAFTDETPLLETVNYYRIQQVDFNGMSDYSKVVSAKPVAEEQTAVIFPNPADQYVQIQVPFHEAVISIALVNPEGKAIEAPAFAIYPGMLRISVGHVADGNYMVRIVTAHKIYAQKLAIKH